MLELAERDGEGFGRILGEMREAKGGSIDDTMISIRNVLRAKWRENNLKKEEEEAAAVIDAIEI